MITIPFPRWLRISAFVAIAVLLFVGTHWPKLRIEGPIKRPDLAIHFIAFGLWSLTLCVSGLLGEPGTRLNAGRCFVIGVVYAAFDESSQLIPALGRFAGLDDYAFNVIGLIIGCSLSLLIRTHEEPRPLRRV
ncbi:MAG: VanZ family protein [Phycisphaerales bacterium]|nr:VanZ family protein [Phycisphaerales bacterium]MCB9835377.1 VanZ family protein [Phycisphaera sp.]